jgi:hypothetical protein
MLHAGLDLSRKKLHVCLLSDEGEHVDQLAVPTVDRVASRRSRVDPGLTLCGPLTRAREADDATCTSSAATRADTAPANDPTPVRAPPPDMQSRRRA